MHYTRRGGCVSRSDVQRTRHNECQQGQVEEVEFCHHVPGTLVPKSQLRAALGTSLKASEIKSEKVV